MAKKLDAKTNVQEDGQFAYAGLDRSMHERARLGIMTSLISQPNGLLFSQLKSLCDLTDGNLKRHLEVLEEEGLVRQEKSQVSNRVLTSYQLTDIGRKRFLEYLEELQRVIDNAQEAAKLKPAQRLLTNR